MDEQDPLAKPAVDLAAHIDVARTPNTLGRSFYDNAHVQECGGEPELQKWNLGSPEAGFLEVMQNVIIGRLLISTFSLYLV